MNNNKFPLKILSSTEVKADLSTIKFDRYDYEYYMMEYVVDGAGFVECGDKKYHCCKDSIYFFQPGGTYHYYHDPAAPWSKIFVIFTGELADLLVEAYNLTGKVYFPGQSRCLPYFRELLHLKYNADEAASLVIHQIFNLLRERETTPDNIPEPICKLKEHIESNLHNKFILKEFSQFQNVSSAYLIAQFKRYYHCTPYEYLLQCRLTSAVNMLKYTHLSIKEIASLLNFNDQYYFSNLFKHRYGISPKKFRGNKNS